MFTARATTVTVTEEQIIDVLSFEKIPKEMRERIIRRLNIYNSLNQNGENEDKSTWIDNMNLSSGVKNALRRNRIYTEQQLKLFVCEKGIKELLLFRNIGEKRFEEMKEVFPWLKDF